MDKLRRLVSIFYAWVLPIRPLKIDLWGTLGWKWYGGYGRFDAAWTYRLEK